ncbi:Uncharacterised protein [Actinobacillus pleuropneumoniae]|nr:Uncharacterised protein [Actinobacillus pleuropneumoniae]
MGGLFLFMLLGLRLDRNGHFQILQIGICDTIYLMW